MNRHVALVVAFIVGALAMGLAGSLSGVFDRGPTQQDVVASREAGYAAAEEATAQRMQLEADRKQSEGYQRGLLATEAAPLLDYLPNPSGLIAGAIAGREDLEVARYDRRRRSLGKVWRCPGYRLPSDRIANRGKPRFGISANSTNLFQRGSFMQVLAGQNLATAQ